jgi:aspartyl protease family protein
MAAVVRQLPRLIAAAALALASAGALAQAVTLAGRMGQQALLVIDGRTHVVAPGQTRAGVTLLRWQDDRALLELGGGTLSLRVGAEPVRLAGSGTASADGSRAVVIPVGPGGHFTTEGSINGRAVRFMVDTGATTVALARAEAERLGLDLRGARTALTQTAAGPVTVHRVTLARLRLGEVELAGVQAVVTPMPMPYVLLGNSVLERFQMRRDNDVMRLELR